MLRFDGARQILSSLIVRKVKITWDDNTGEGHMQRETHTNRGKVPTYILYRHFGTRRISPGKDARTDACIYAVP